MLSPFCFESLTHDLRKFFRCRICVNQAIAQYSAFGFDAGLIVHVDGNAKPWRALAGAFGRSAPAEPFGLVELAVHHSHNGDVHGGEPFEDRGFATQRLGLDPDWVPLSGKTSQQVGCAEAQAVVTTEAAERGQGRDGEVLQPAPAEQGVVKIEGDGVLGINSAASGGCAQFPLAARRMCRRVFRGTRSSSVPERHQRSFWPAEVPPERCQ